jgi:hypothetical protein
LFYVDYGYRNLTSTRYFLKYGVPFGWGIRACMTNDNRGTWESTANRQDVFEVLYLNITANSLSNGNNPIESGFYKVTLNTTAGYFELSNYMNKGRAGPLLDKGPQGTCDGGDDCEWVWVDRDLMWV